MSTDIPALKDFGSPDSEMGDEEGDHPSEYREPGVIRVMPGDEVDEYYRQLRPEDIQIRDRSGGQS
jgi:hypothetical protein